MREPISEAGACGDMAILMRSVALTNWGNDVDSINRALGPTALIQNISVVQSIQSHLLSTCIEDGHVDGCRIVSICRSADSR